MRKFSLYAGVVLAFVGSILLWAAWLGLPSRIVFGWQGWTLLSALALLLFGTLFLCAAGSRTVEKRLPRKNQLFRVVAVGQRQDDVFLGLVPPDREEGEPALHRVKGSAVSEGLEIKSGDTIVNLAGTIVKAQVFTQDVRKSRKP